jgi:hypothetical protein
MKRPQSVAELKEQLSDQMGFLLASAEAFDGGDVSEAKRLAVALRVLLHESAYTGRHDHSDRSA